MRALQDLLWEGFEPTPEDVGRIMSRAAGLLRYGHDQGAVHGDLTAETLLVERRGDDWGVELAQPRHPVAAGSVTAADDVHALGRVLDQLVRTIPENRLPDLFPAALASMTDADPAHRPRTSQVEEFFSQDYPAGLLVSSTAGPTTVVQVPLQVPTDGVDGWRPSGTGAIEDDDDMVHHTPQAQERRGGRGAVVLVSALVLLLGMGGVWFALLRTPAVDEHVVVSPDTPPDADDQEGQEAAGEQAPDQAGTATGELSGGATDLAADDLPTAKGEDASASHTRPDVPVPTTPVSSAPRQTAASEDHTNPDWEGRGWDVGALNSAYCRDGSHFIGLADTETYRGVICGHASGYSYRGLNKAANATLHSSAEPLGSGWQALGDGGVRYEFDEHTFAISDGRGSVLDEEEVTTWVTPGGTPFRPGDLNVSEPITYPACDGSAVVVLGSWQSGGVVDQLVQDALDDNPGSYYVRTDLACDNFNRPSPDLSEMNYIYSVLRPVGYDHDLACDAIEEAGTYGYWLQEGVDPGIHIDCD